MTNWRGSTRAYATTTRSRAWHAHRNVVLGMWKRRRRSRGVTLIEILVVLGIIALISGVVAVALLVHFERAREVTTRQSALALRTAATMWRMQKASGDCPDVPTLMADDAIDQASRAKDAWEQPFRITCDERGGIHVVSGGRDKKLDTEDDIHVP
jgi:prepilin-type N-terminal cleavage/methylation domain-containing protein